MPTEKSVTEDAKKNSTEGAKKVAKLTRSKPPEPPPPHWMVRVIKAPVVLAVIWPVLLVVGGYAAWHRWGAERIGQQFYRLDRQAVSITPAPEYVRADIVSEVFKTHQLERTSLLSRMATARVGEAFKTHPWIERVVRVEKRADGVEVKVLYRKPVAMVRVKSRHPDISGDALFAIDGEGILLPIDDFSVEETQKYIQIIVPDSYPSGVGAPYGDERVMAAARIAALLTDDRESLQLAAIELTNPRRTFDESWIFAVIRSDATRFIWGSPPGEEVDGEPSAAQKLEMIRARPTIAGDLRLAKYRN